MRCFSRCSLHSRPLPLPASKGNRDSLTTTDGTITLSANSTTLVIFAVPQAGSLAGQLFSAMPASPTYLNEDDVITLTPSGAAGASIPMHFSVVVRAA